MHRRCLPELIQLLRGWRTIWAATVRTPHQWIPE